MKWGGSGGPYRYPNGPRGPRRGFQLIGATPKAPVPQCPSALLKKRRRPPQKKERKNVRFQLHSHRIPRKFTYKLAQELAPEGTSKKPLKNLREKQNSARFPYRTAARNTKCFFCDSRRCSIRKTAFQRATFATERGKYSKSIF